jgi:1-acyl-sn-glycerol-3-phosphate acyltransferase
MDVADLVRDPRFKQASRGFLKLLRKYFRIEVVGIENIPKRGRVIVAPNHSGYAGFDAVLLGHVILRETGRVPRVMAHRAFFDFSRTVRRTAESFGLRKASLKGGVEILRGNRLMIIFPEGESGNFKPTAKAYQLRRFRTGFIRMALQAQAQIVPCVIIGAEETHLNLGNIDLSKLARGLKIPLPLNLIPLPAKWRIHFLPPVALPAGELSEEQIERLALRIQRQAQKAIHAELKARPYIYFKSTRKLLEKARAVEKRTKTKLSKVKREAVKIRRAARLKARKKARAR